MACRNLKRNTCIFIQENAFENVVCETASIFLCLNVLKLLLYTTTCVAVYMLETVIP